MSENRVPVTPVYDNGPDKEFLKRLEKGEHLKPFPGKTHSSPDVVKRAKKISDKYPFKFME